ncbi:hypothetical protein EJ05DRAFT_477667 [Pseudovirgaria hyperparasitica]|uniref:Uncharacterized protein n=1 Tax=Pseudovirgaria hyperparasitica TaxID=470096 RepID=A0A6A6W1W5_9PEZI|nr:uncharacterized protein EJ05DRAFT_477667 [Pseudovirgaria hyperparasitica]KAF2756543.1 hypothetical protein EJ05DRAFT_477667 [Pseudovirgaria hyperparasitica]
MRFFNFNTILAAAMLALPSALAADCRDLETCLTYYEDAECKGPLGNVTGKPFDGLGSYAVTCKNNCFHYPASFKSLQFDNYDGVYISCEVFTDSDCRKNKKKLESDHGTVYAIKDPKGDHGLQRTCAKHEGEGDWKSMKCVKSTCPDWSLAWW